jgi:uncharacterized protein with GYD domain
MATYICLSSFTDQGIRSVKETTQRADAVRDSAKKFGVSVKEIYWTLGNVDVVAIFEAPDETAMTAFALTLGSAGNVRTQLLRAFTKEEMKGVIKKMAGGKVAVPA